MAMRIRVVVAGWRNNAGTNASVHAATRGTIGSAHLGRNLGSQRIEGTMKASRYEIPIAAVVAKNGMSTCAGSLAAMSASTDSALP
jgi:broad specificity polyphosphatase/5'/3'-nucleotidase SurE